MTNMTLAAALPATKTPALARGSSRFENLADLRYDAVGDRLIAEIVLGRPRGFGAASTHGSTEFVRFFVEVDGVWVDWGLVACRVDDESLPLGTRRRVALPIGCRAAGHQTLEVRAILSWQMIPPARRPDWQPVWGHVLNATLQLVPAVTHRVYSWSRPAPPSGSELLSLGQSALR